MRVVFFGGSKFVIPIIEILHKTYELDLVVTTERERFEAVPTYCIENSIPYKPITSFDSSMKETIMACNVDVAVLAHFGIIVPEYVLEAYSHGIINIHPSLLPKYRGPTPVQTAILNGDSGTGVTIIKLDEEVDHGPILAQEKEKILPTDTSESLHKRLFEKGAQLLSPILQNIQDNKKVKETQQDHSKATFTKHLTRESGYFDAENSPSKENLDRMIRAYYPWPGVWTLLRLKASDGQTKEKRIKFLPNKMVQVEGKKPLSYKDFLNGYPEEKEKLKKMLS